LVAAVAAATGGAAADDELFDPIGAHRYGPWSGLQCAQCTGLTQSCACMALLSAVDQCTLHVLALVDYACIIIQPGVGWLCAPRLVKVDKLTSTPSSL
jgi:hypothetical protein